MPLVMHQDHGQSPDVCRGAIDLGFSSVMMDGSLEADGKTIASYDYNVDVTRKVADMAHKVGVTVEGELGCLGSLETMEGDKEDGHGADGTLDPRAAADRPRAGRRLRQAHPARRAGDRHRHQPRRLQVHPQAHRRHPGDRPHQGNPPPHPQHPPGDARLVERAAGTAGDHPPVRRQHEGNLRRAGRGNPGSHQARRAQDQHRHRHPPGDDRRGAQVPGREPREVRRPRMAQAGARSRRA